MSQVRPMNVLSPFLSPVATSMIFGCAICAGEPSRIPGFWEDRFWDGFLPQFPHIPRTKVDKHLRRQSDVRFDVEIRGELGRTGQKLPKSEPEVISERERRYRRKTVRDGRQWRS